MKTHTVTCLNADSRCTVFVVDVPEKLGFWWAVKDSHTVTFTEGEPFPSGKQLTDVPSDEVFTYYGNGCGSCATASERNNP